MSPEWELTLDEELGATLTIEFSTHGPEVTDYAVVLVLRVGCSTETIRVYDGAHGRNEVHRCGRRSGKGPGSTFDHGTLGEGMRAAKAEIEAGYRGMIEGWERQ